MGLVEILQSPQPREAAYSGTITVHLFMQQICLEQSDDIAVRLDTTRLNLRERTIMIRQSD